MSSHLLRGFCFFFVALLLASSTAAGCAPRPGNADAAENRRAASDSVAASSRADTLLTLDRSTCLGPCPSYTLTVFGSGRVVYNGRDYVEVTDTVRTQISDAKVERLAEAFRAADYFDYQRSYGRGDEACAVWMPDFPTVRTSFRGGERRQRVQHYHGCYARRTEGGDLKRADRLVQLAALEDSVDAIVGTARWTGE
jgi:hypothetical protein